MTTMPSSLSPSRTTCASLLRELQIIWDEIGESDGERDKMLLQLEQECLDIYRRKVENTRKYKATLHQSLAEAELEINTIVAALGEHASFSRFEKGKGTLKEQILAFKPVLEDLRLRKKERVDEFLEIQSQIAHISAEIAGNGQSKNYGDPQIDEHDLTVKRLAELKLHFKELQNEKALRLQKVTDHLSSIHELSIVMSFDFLKTVHEIHPSLSKSSCGYSKSISNDTLARLTDLINSLKQQKQQRLKKLQDLGKMLIELWDLMDTPVDERKRFEHVTNLISSSVNEVSRQGSLSLEALEQTEVEVEQLNTLKASKLKELVFKRQNELEEIYRGVHMDIDSDAARQILISLIDSDDVDLSDLLSSMDDQIVKAKEQALSRKDILEKVEKWKFASEEERWLDDYERDENRYTAGKGVHKNLKRAEKARLLVSKIPSMVESLTAKVKAWELEKGVSFLYDKVSLLSSLEEYTVRRQEREEEKRKSREQKRLQEQLAVEQEALFGSRPTPKKPLGLSSNANTMAATPNGRRAATALGRLGVSAGKERRESGRANNITPVNYVSLPKDDQVSRGN
ncbi:Microtubule-associated protein, MAP65/Ase1/PRC [Trema orientale]|uniref:Microtubule-associated protein, MAP65/Ase1/PRC n=1 Tax=Trema orientale TaxID=63057 RepID=A0A2P5AYR1_TREOI|nr:Microtubule-associated protein, MAP65/Ase1/PRC [Trema orientale]